MLDIAMIFSGLCALLVFYYLRCSNAKLAQRNRNCLDKVDWYWIIGLTIVYAAISVINFAANNKYHSVWTATRTPAQLVMTFNHATPIEKLYVVTALNSGDFSVTLFDSNNVAIESSTWSAAKLSAAAFRWNQASVKHNMVPISKVTLTASHEIVDLNAVVFIDKHSKVFTDYQVYAVGGQLKQSWQYLMVNRLPTHVDDGWLSGTVFDEIYYATSAYQYLHGISPGAWVNPQLGVLLIALGIIIFGMSPLGWRILPIISGICLIPMMYMFAKRIFESRKTAVMVSILMGCEFMHYTICRLALIEPFVALFLVIEYYYLYCYVDARLNGAKFIDIIPSLFGIGMYLGLAMASKWVAIFSAPAIFVCVLVCEIKPRVVMARFNFKNMWPILQRGVDLILLLVILPLLVYLLSYVPYAIINHSTDNFFTFIYQLHLWMLDFNLHGLLHVTHPYASKFWSWPLDLMPLSVYYWQDAHGYMSQSMVLMGNPAIFWPTWVLITLLAFRFFSNRHDYRAGFLLLVLICQYLPYVLISRISFIYYFYSVTPLLVLAIGYVLNLSLSNNKSRAQQYLAFAYVLLVVVLFILFFPSLSAMMVPRSYTVNVLWWLKSWNF